MKDDVVKELKDAGLKHWLEEVKKNSSVSIRKRGPTPGGGKREMMRKIIPFCIFAVAVWAADEKAPAKPA